MARNGSGTYSRVAGTPYVYNTVIDQTVVNSEMDDIATALTASIAKDGQTTPTANLPMGGYLHTNVAAATARTHYARAAEVQDNTLQYLTGVAGTNTITASCPLSMTAYVVGQEFDFTPAATNTGAATLNINSIGAGAVQLAGKALAGKELRSGIPVSVRVTATTPVFEIVSNGAFVAHGVRVDIASAATLDLDAATSRYLRITGSTTVTAVTLADGEMRDAVMSGAVQFTNGSSLIVPGGTYTTTAGDMVRFFGEASGVVRLQIIRATGSGPASGTAVASTSGTSIDFTGIPDGVKLIHISFGGVSLSGTANLLVQIGDSGGIETSSYISNFSASSSAGVGDLSSSSGFICSLGNASGVTRGVMTLACMDAANYSWVASVAAGWSNGVNNYGCAGGGLKSLSATLDRVRITTSNGTDTFDAGTINILYE